MNKDRRLNGWVLLSSILGIISGVVLLTIGGLVGIVGFLKPEKLLKFDDLIFFVNQAGIIKAQKTMFDALLKTEVLYLAIGIIVAIIGLVALILAIVALNYAKKRKVVQHRVALIVFTLIPIAVISCAGIYLFKEFKVLTDNIKYITYGIIGVFGVVTLFNILGVIFGRSEKFMSNDNSKYAFDNSSLRNARANVNNTVKEAQVQPNIVKAQTSTQPQSIRPNSNFQRTQPQQQRSMQRVQNSQTNLQGVRPIQPMQNMQAKSQGVRPVQPVRPLQAVRPQQNSQMVARPMPPRATANMGQSRPVAHAGQTPQRPVQNVQNTQRNLTQSQYCAKCGKKLLPGEKFCSLCGTKAAE